MNYPLIKEENFTYIQQGEGESLVLLHGLFGSPSNYKDLIVAFGEHYKVLAPVVPIFELSTKEISVTRLAQNVQDFIMFKQLDGVHLLGNSLGGHVGLVTTLMAPKLVHTLTLTGSSGLFEQGLGRSFPRRQSYDYVQETTAATFYDPKIATKELVDEIFDLINDKEKALKLVVSAKSAMRHNLENELHQIKVPTLLIWGKEDQITPPFVAEEFHKKISDSTLHFIDKCGHAPMMEKPQVFIQHLKDFLAHNAV